MIRPTRWKAGLALAIVAALAAVPAAPALAAPPAGDEYVLEIPGVRDNASGPVAAAPAASPTAGENVQRGVVGESDSPSSPLAALGDALGSIPASVLTGLIVLLGLAVSMPVLTSRRGTAPRGSR